MGNAHIILVFDDGLAPFLEKRKDKRDAAFAEIGKKIVELCEAHANPIQMFPGDDDVAQSKTFKTASLDEHGNAIVWCGFPGSAQDHVLYWGTCLKPIQQLNDQQLGWVKKAVEKEIANRG